MSDKTQSNHPGEAVKAESHDPKQGSEGMDGSAKASPASPQSRPKSCDPHGEVAELMNDLTARGFF